MLRLFLCYYSKIDFIFFDFIENVISLGFKKIKRDVAQSG